MTRIVRNSHFLGAKLRALRKQNHMTLEELSMRCIQVDPRAAPSVSLARGAVSTMPHSRPRPRR